MSEHASIVVAGDSITIRVPMKVRRRAGRKWIEVPGGARQPDRLYGEMPSAIAIAVARAHRWQELLDQGRYASITELAKALAVDFAYVARLLQLTLLAPDIVEAVLDGWEPSGLSLEKLRRTLPAVWEEQIKIFQI